MHATTEIHSIVYVIIFVIFFYLAKQNAPGMFYKHHAFVLIHVLSTLIM